MIITLSHRILRKICPYQRTVEWPMLFFWVVFLIVKEAEEIIIRLSVRLPHKVRKLAPGAAYWQFKIHDSYYVHFLFSQILIATRTIPITASRVVTACPAIKSRIALFLFIRFWQRHPCNRFSVLAPLWRKILIVISIKLSIAV